MRQSKRAPIRERRIQLRRRIVPRAKRPRPHQHNASPRRNRDPNKRQEKHRDPHESQNRPILLHDSRTLY